jgi:hypothetical protein
MLLLYSKRLHEQKNITSVLCIDERDWRASRFLRVINDYYVVFDVYYNLLNNKEFRFFLIGLNRIFSTLPQSEYTLREVYSGLTTDQPKPRCHVSSASVNYYSLLNYDCKPPYTEVDEMSLKWPPFVHLDISSKPFHVQKEITEWV